MDTTTANTLKQIAAALHCVAAAIDTLASVKTEADQKAPSFLPDAEEQSLREEAAKKSAPVIGTPKRLDPAFVEAAKKEVNGTAVAVVEPAVEKTEAPAKKVATKAKKVEAAPVAEEQKKEGMTLAEFRDAISPIAAAKGFDKVKKIFAAHGANVISQVKPEEYAAILEEIKNA